MVSKAKRFWIGLKLFLTAFPKWFGIYMGLCGLVFFNLFILEEAQQQAVYSTWSVKDTGEWRLLQKNVILLQSINKASSTINRCFGWINPLGWLAYGKYNESEIAQIASMRSMLFANAPELLQGEKITFTFRPAEKENMGDHWRLRNNMITVLSTKDFDSEVATGVVTVQSGTVVIDVRNK